MMLQIDCDMVLLPTVVANTNSSPFTVTVDIVSAETTGLRSGLGTGGLQLRKLTKVSRRKINDFVFILFFRFF